MPEPLKPLYDATLSEMIGKVRPLDPTTKEATTAIINLDRFAKAITPTPEPESIPVPTTYWGKTKAVVRHVWDSPTFQVLIKTAGSFGGVALVVHSTVKRDHVLERQAYQEATRNHS
jgi:hypothetical protein